MELYNRIRLARRLKGWSQSQLAKQLGLSTSAVGHWERPQGHMPATSKLVKLAKLLEVSFEWLTTGREPMTVHDGSSTGVKMQNPLTPEEKQLLIRYRCHPQRAQSALLEFLKLMSSSANDE